MKKGLGVLSLLIMLSMAACTMGDVVLDPEPTQDQSAQEELAPDELPVSSEPAATGEDLGTESSCTAYCQTGSVTVSCSGTCEAVDQVCGTQTRGHARCLSTGVIKYCNQCTAPTCSPKQCSLACGGPGAGTCVNGQCYCY